MPSVALMAVLIAMSSLPAAQQPPEPIQASVGTLSIDAKLPVGSVRGDYFEAGWLFIDGRLIGRLPIERTVTLDWGSHDLRLVVGAYTNEQPRYYTVRWPRYVVNSGSTHSFQPAAVVEMAVNGGPLPAGVELISSPEPRPREELASQIVVSPDAVATLQQRIAADMRKEWEAFEQGEFPKIEKVRAELQEKGQPASSVWIPIAEALGGPREFDADQLRFLARVLRPDIGGWRDKVVHYSPSLTVSQRQSAEASIAKLKYANEFSAEYVARTFRELIQLLGRRP